MGPNPSQLQSAELFISRLDEQLNMRHPLVKLAALIDWTDIERTFAASFTSCRGRPALPAPQLERYATLHSQTYGEKVELSALIPHMLATFVARDRAFNRMKMGSQRPLKPS